MSTPRSEFMSQHELISPVYLPPSESLGALHMFNVLSIDPFGRPLPIPSHSLGSTRGQIVPRCEFVHIGHGHDFMT